MTPRLFVALVAGTVVCAVGAAHAQQPASPSPAVQTPAKSPAPAEAPDSQGHDAQTGKPETAHTAAPKEGPDGTSPNSTTTGKSADETSGKMDDGKPTKPAK